MFRGNFNRRIGITRATNTPSSLARLPDDLLGSTVVLKPLFLVAQGHNLLWNKNNPVWPKPYYGPTIDQKICNLIIHARKLINTTTAPKVISSYRFAELTAIQAFKGDPITVEDINNSRMAIDSYLRNTPLQTEDIDKIINSIITEVCEAPHLMLTREEFSSNTGIPISELPKEEYALQKQIWFTSRANVITLCNFVTGWTGEWIAFFEQLDNLNDNAILNKPTDPVAHFTGDINALWFTTSKEVRLSWYEAFGFIDNNTRRKFSVCANIAYIITMVKGSNFTQAWANKIIENLDSNSNNLHLAESLDADTILQYAQMYPRGGLTPNTIYDSLLGIYNVCQDDELGKIRWILEQATAQNISSATALSEAILKPTFVPIDALIRVIGEDQFKAVVTLSAWVTYDAFSTIIQPQIITSQYPDLAYIAVTISFREMGRVNSAYKGNTAKICKKSIRELNAIAESINALNNNVASAPFQAINLAKSLYAGRNVIEIGDYLYVSPPNPAINPDNVGLSNANLSAQELANIQRVDDEQVRAARTGWPRNARGLPTGTIQISVEDLVDLGSNNYSDKAKAFLLCLTYIRENSRQKPLEIFESNRLNPTQRKKVLPNDLQDALRVWEVPILQEWITPPEPINAKSDTTPHSLSDFYVLSRRLSKVDLVGGSSGSKNE